MMQAQNLRLGFGSNSVAASSQPPKDTHEVISEPKDDNRVGLTVLGLDPQSGPNYPK